jgi:hypothetical protein
MAICQFTRDERNSLAPEGTGHGEMMCVCGISIPSRTVFLRKVLVVDPRNFRTHRKL